LAIERAVARETQRHYAGIDGCAARASRNSKMEKIMAWTTPTLVEICIGLEINGYLPAEF
jgi:coenzyme PQQ precursor peptide PqqA